MDRKTAKELLPVIKAYAEGKVIQMKSSNLNKWEDAVSPAFTLPTNNYRIKPEPREFYMAFREGFNSTGPVFHSEKSAERYINSSKERPYLWSVLKLIG